MLLKIFYLHHDLFSVAARLLSEYIKLIFCILLHEDIVLVEHLDGLMDLKNLSSLHILKVDLPLLCLLAERVQLALQVRNLTLSELFKSAHYLLDTGNLFGQGVIGHARMFDRLLLKGVHLINLVFQGGFEELLALGDCIRDLGHLLN